MSAIVLGMVLPWMLIALGVSLGYQLVLQNGCMLLRLESIEKLIGPRAAFGGEVVAMNSGSVAV